MIGTLIEIDLTLAHNILTIQRPSYQNEADLIVFQGIPVLSERDQFVGVLSYEECEEVIDI